MASRHEASRHPVPDADDSGGPMDANAPKPRCPKCEYDVGGLEVAGGMVKCPECGDTASPRLSPGKFGRLTFLFVAASLAPSAAFLALIAAKYFESRDALGELIFGAPLSCLVWGLICQTIVSAFPRVVGLARAEWPVRVFIFIVVVTANLVIIACAASGVRAC